MPNLAPPSRGWTAFAIVLAAGLLVYLGLAWFRIVRIPLFWPAPSVAQDQLSVATATVLAKVASARWRCESVKSPGQADLALNLMKEAADAARFQAALVEQRTTPGAARHADEAPALRALRAEALHLHTCAEAAARSTPERADVLRDGAADLRDAIETFLSAAGGAESANRD